MSPRDTRWLLTAEYKITRNLFLVDMLTDSQVDKVGEVVGRGEKK
jgi:hypothetical protein